MDKFKETRNKVDSLFSQCNNSVLLIVKKYIPTKTVKYGKFPLSISITGNPTGTMLELMRKARNSRKYGTTRKTYIDFSTPEEMVLYVERLSGLIQKSNFLKNRKKLYVISFDITMPEDEAHYASLQEAITKSKNNKAKFVVQDKKFKDKYECRSHFRIHGYIWTSNGRVGNNLENIRSELGILFGLLGDERISDTHEIPANIWRRYCSSSVSSYGYSFTLYHNKDFISMLSFVNSEVVELEKIEVIFEPTET